MRKDLLIGLLVAGLVSTAGAQTPPPISSPATGRTIAVTFEGLPFVDAAADVEDALENATRATDILVRVLTAHGVPVVGFVNEASLNSPERDARTALLQRWAEAGTTLGNTPEKKLAIERSLAARGYRVAPYTIDVADETFNAAFVVAWRMEELVRKYQALSQYADFVVAATDFAERTARQMFGRDIPHVMRLHANDINVEMLDEILNRLERRGYRFVTLDTAMNDPAYRTKDTVAANERLTWLARWAQSLQLSVDFSGQPVPPAWVVDFKTAAEVGRR